MSDTLKLVLWTVVAVVVIAIIVWLFVNAGPRREVETRRFQAGERRARVQGSRPEARERHDHAGVPATAGEAPRLEQRTEQHRAPAPARAGHAVLERRTDLVDRDAPADGDDDDLADAGNPFARAGSDRVHGESAGSHAAAGYAEDGPGDAGADPDDTVDGDPVDDQTNENHVDVPALDDRDDVLADGGTPSGDPGDHRGQPWATTPGQRGPEDSGEPADEGRDVDMAPHSHESDEASEVAEPAGSTSEQPRRQEAEPASDVAEAAYPDEDADTDEDRATGQRAQQQDAPSPSGRRVSSFDEVVDGGFGLGSAAPVGDGAQPLGHAIKGTREGATFLGPDDEGYDETEPDVWFYNEEAARRAGFTKRGE